VKTLVIDTSAIVAVLSNEPEAPLLETLLLEAGTTMMSDVNLFELRVVMLRRRGMPGVIEADGPIRLLGIRPMPFDTTQAQASLAAYARFGKGIHPKARLNLADCPACASAMTMGLPLLFKGHDFTHTDVLATV